MLNRTHKSRKAKQAVRQQKLPMDNVGKIADQRAKKYMKNHPGIGYSEALRACFSRDKRLPKAYNRARRPRDPLSGLKALAEFLNGSGADQQALLSEIVPLVAWRDTPTERVKEAAENLAAKLSRVTAHWHPLPVKGKPVFAITFSTGHYGIIARALQYGDWSKLKRCRWCETFFVHADHRRDFCPQKRCFSQHEAQRVKDWRTRTGN